ncbi:MAG: sugar ABC transporter ATP-binding protein [Chloroflexota bacterium]|nr:sugar ABC transporter ATP-binding protein [Chloroflexota bacterium]
MTSLQAPILEVHHVSKEFPGVRALDNVHFVAYPGEVHALVGENGAGKSTLMKILAGAYQPDRGEIIFKGDSYQSLTPREAQALGIAIIYQELNLIEEMSVAENIFLGREPRSGPGVIDYGALIDATRALLARLQVKLDPQRRVKRLTVAEQQMVEIAKALSFNADLIIMDEPSAILAGDELQALFDVINTLRAEGVAIIYISHRLDEVFQIADRATILKDGQVVHSGPISGMSKGQLIRYMVGRELSEGYPTAATAPREPILRVLDLSAGEVVHDISFSVRRGEIVGIAGLVGSGRTDLARALFGALPIDEGEVWLGEKQLKLRNPQDAIRHGIALLPEDRKREGLVLDQSLLHNMTLPIIGRVSRWAFIPKKIRVLVDSMIETLQIRTAGVEQEVQYLSGGNQQKVVLGKWLLADPEVIILDEPTRGIDVGAKFEIYRLMRELSAGGKAILMISSELPEVLGMSDRILVMHEGRLQGELAGATATEEEVMFLATGHELSERDVEPAGQPVAEPGAYP